MEPDWNLISRAIIPLVHTQSPMTGGGSESGVGDVLQSAFFSPKAPTAGGWTYGALARRTTCGRAGLGAACDGHVSISEMSD